jgi:hypothetical protein
MKFRQVGGAPRDKAGPLLLRLVDGAGVYKSRIGRVGMGWSVVCFLMACSAAAPVSSPSVVAGPCKVYDQGSRAREMQPSPLGARLNRVVNEIERDLRSLQTAAAYIGSQGPASYEGQRISLVSKLDAEKQAAGVCFSDTLFGSQVQEAYAKIQSLEASAARDIRSWTDHQSWLARGRSLAESIAPEVRSQTSGSTRVTLESAREAQGITHVEVRVTNVSSSALVRLNTIRVFSSDRGTSDGRAVVLGAGSFPIGLAMRDNNGNDLRLAKIEPEIFGEVASPLRPGDSVLVRGEFAGSFPDVAETIRLSVLPELLGVREGVSIVIDRRRLRDTAPMARP